MSGRLVALKEAGGKTQVLLIIFGSFLLSVSDCHGTEKNTLNRGEPVAISLQGGTEQLCGTIPQPLCEPAGSVISLLQELKPACSTIADHKPYYDTLYEYIQYQLFFEPVFEQSYGPWDSEELSFWSKAYSTARELSGDSGMVFSDKSFIMAYNDVRNSIVLITDTLQALMSEHDGIESVHLMDPCYTLWSVYPSNTPRAETSAGDFEEGLVRLAATPSFVETCVEMFRPHPAVCVMRLEEGYWQLHYPCFLDDHLLYSVEVIFFCGT